MQPSHKTPVCVDFETYYDSDYSLRKMSAVKYVYDERFACLIVAIVGNGIKYVGPAETAPWHSLIGQPLLAHNMSFDGQVLQRLQRDGIVPDLKTPFYCDSTDVGCYFQHLRSLDKMAPSVLGLAPDAVSKKVRDQMKGRSLESLSDAERKALLEYGAKDAELSLAIWQKLVDDWPEKERWCASRNIQRGFEGIRIDIPRLERGIELFEEARVNLLRQMPWVPEFPPMSDNARHAQARADGITSPASIAAEDEAAIAWENKYSNQFAWVRAVRNFRRVNSFLLKLKALKDAVVDGRFRFSMKYFGAAATGRFSGGGGFNIQNLPKKPAAVCKNCWTVLLEDIDEETGEGISDNVTPMHEPCERCGSRDREELDLRGLFLADEGCAIVACDFAQIEARLLLWEANDQHMLKMLEKDPITGKRMSVYEAHARATMGWTGGSLKKEDAAKYALAKARVLSLGYGLGTPAKFVKQAKKYANVDLTTEQAKATIDEYRAANPLIVKMWRDNHGWLTCSANAMDDTHEIQLASGRVIKYFEPRFAQGFTKEGKPKQEIKVRVTQGGGNPRRIYGAMLVQNLTQANAREVMLEGHHAVHHAGIPCAFEVHDELVATSVKLDRVKETMEAMMELMPAAANTFVKGCPIEVEGATSDRYFK